jgi:bacterioferritin
MQGNPKVIEILNEVLTGELTAINQYFLHAAMAKNWGFEKIYQKVYHESIDEMKHAQVITDRVLFLDGIPNLQKLDKLNIGETIPEQYASDLKLELLALERLRRGVQLCTETHDHTTRQLLESILEDEEQHVDWLETQLNIIETIGLQNYLTEMQA